MTLITEFSDPFVLATCLKFDKLQGVLNHPPPGLPPFQVYHALRMNEKDGNSNAKVYAVLDAYDERRRNLEWSRIYGHEDTISALVAGAGTN